ncbi:MULTISPECIES: glutaredoxin family protein [Tenacibaculum]|uniref:Glutaredoxin n=1 Tax=Tenacibaculum discolor TaxID=361581 RepID=A0A2G1BSY3_9FLAO|nr:MULTISPECIES: glutaredoxin domain-containing protein [Tenacibaculum]MEE3999274.1 glutaredoxin domain-containing protein [Tenacibaculum sp. FZY0031]MDP2542181.1 glutaredoxin domain-containing protein [Tenacibaculum discolor]NVK09338.1 glutaredoxin [Tenacibaculum sp.]PHN96685.1 glutaredoxin [Tenacibaculum discolor]RLK00350.1 glutaredoxin [Tenacibaculum discolor]
MKIVLYGRKGHAHTVAYKNFLKSAEVPFEYKDVSVDNEAKEHTKELYDGQVKYPTLFVDEEVYLTPSSDTFNKLMQDLKLKG